MPTGCRRWKVSSTVPSPRAAAGWCWQRPSPFWNGCTPTRSVWALLPSLSAAQPKKQNARILFATYQLAKEGLDIPCLDRLVLATPTRNKVIVQQSIGRIQRPAPGKTEALVIDLVDEKTPQLLVQYKQRRTLYRKMNITEKE